MKRASLVEFSIKHPVLTVVTCVILTGVAASQLPKITIDTNPKNMLPETSTVRVFNDEVESTFSLYEDVIVVGIAHPNGIFNAATLEKVQRITDEITNLPNVAARDVSSLTTIMNVTAENGALKVAPPMTEVPRTDEELAALRKSVLENPLFIGRIISADGKTTAIYVPLEEGANGKEIADKIREVVGKERGDEQFYVAGDPVARDTFGAVMFKLMGVFSPLAGLIMFIAIFLMFRNLSLCMSMMAVAMIAITWSMGLLIGLGFPVHIMSSMSPVFLMAIATDSIHIFNEFNFRYREKRDKTAAIIETMQAVGRPVRFTALATAVGFGVLMLMHIIPVQVFGGLVAFGTIALRVLSFSFIPAVLTFISAEKLEKAARAGDVEGGWAERFLRRLGYVGAHRPVITVAIGVVLLGGAILGISKIVVNNNMVEWFKSGSEVRTADTVMNQALGGTSLAYIVATANGGETYFQSPEAMHYIDGLQRHLEKLPVVGKTFSVVDYVKRINFVLHDEAPAFDAIPGNKETIGQYLFLFSMSARPMDLENVVDYEFTTANVWVQLKTWDAQAMRDVIAAVNEYKKTASAPVELRPAGIAYFNLVWNDEVLWDMVRGFIIALIAVFIILAFNFRSLKWALIGYIPLLFTVALIYGVVGFIGKDFDMPISVLSCLSLGMAVDFAIHFISRLKQRLAEFPDLQEALLWTAVRPGRGIMRNALLFASAFSVMLFAPLTPYSTVGAFIVSMMVLSALMTIVFLPALIVLLKGWLFRNAAI
ncbi:MAG TPA: MMPL family transporter [Candidatus Deferrimicrobium sp.]|nr:MMPL family transporter [Candidatus Deferrimicrobium sp.]